MKGYDLNLLVALDALLELESVTKAAERLHLSPPAMSHTLARLRAVFDDPLLVRVGQRLARTNKAEILAGPVRDTVGAAFALRDVDDGRDLQAVARTFVVRAPESFATLHGARLAVAMAQTLPRASLRIVSEMPTRGRGLRDGSLDVELSPDTATGPGIRLERLGGQRFVGAARTGHPFLRGRRTSARWLAQPHVDVAGDAMITRVLDDELARQNRRRSVAMTVPSRYAALVIAAGSDLLAIAPQRMVDALSRPLALTAFGPPVPLPEEGLSMAWHVRTDHSPGHVWLRSQLRQAIIHHREQESARADHHPTLGPSNPHASPP